MSVTIVIGGQFGSEGKGKVCNYFMKSFDVCVRCGGPNSGHTVYKQNRKYILKQLPVSVLHNKTSVIGRGSYINMDILSEEIEKISPEKLLIDKYAIILNNEDSMKEESDNLKETIGSTLSGTGTGVIKRIKRSKNTLFAKDVPSLSGYVGDSVKFLNERAEKDRILIEGTQGYGLSIYHTPVYPYATSRDTTAQGFLSECGLSPFLVKDIYMVLRAFPIRVCGNSGPLRYETDWDKLNIPPEYTTVTNKIRRVGYFNPELVVKAISVNRPTKIIMNHLDYIQREQRESFITMVEYLINKPIDFIGEDKYTIIKNKNKMLN